MSSTTILVVFACEHGLALHHLDVEQAYIVDELDDEAIFLQFPPGCGGVSGKVGGLAVLFAPSSSVSRKLGSQSWQY